MDDMDPGVRAALEDRKAIEEAERVKEASEAEKTSEAEETGELDPHDPKAGAIPFFPNHLITEMAVALVFVGIILLLAAFAEPAQFFEAGLSPEEVWALEEPADPYTTPPVIVPEWYFLALFQMLKVVPVWIGVAVIPGLFFTIVGLLPFLDGTKEANPLKRPIFTIGVIVFLIIWLIFTLWGAHIIELGG